MTTSWGLGRPMQLNVLRAVFKQEIIPLSGSGGGEYTFLLSSEIVSYAAGSSIPGLLPSTYGIIPKELIPSNFSSPRSYPGSPEKIYVHSKGKITYLPATVDWTVTLKSAVLAKGATPANYVFWSVPFVVYSPGSSYGYKLKINEVLTIPDGALSFCLSGGGLS